VKDLLQRVDIRIDEHASINFERGIGAEVKRFRRQLLGARQFVCDVMLCEKACDEARFLFLASGEKPNGHPPLPCHPGSSF
jgi:hypothetical protein